MYLVIHEKKIKSYGGLNSKGTTKYKVIEDSTAFTRSRKNLHLQFVNHGKTKQHEVE